MSVEPHVAAFICPHIHDASRPILLVGREDGDWMLMCGDAHDFATDPGSVVGIGHLLERDPSLREVMDLPDGYEAERAAAGAPWTRRPMSSS